MAIHRDAMGGKTEIGVDAMTTCVIACPEAVAGASSSCDLSVFVCAVNARCMRVHARVCACTLVR